MNRLETILAHKQREIEERLQTVSPEQLERDIQETLLPPDFREALRRPPGAPVRLIAEIKRASPSRGQMAPIANPIELARCYQQNGAAAISVLTDARFFSGSLEDLRAIAALPQHPPLLRKDFILHPIQILEARAAGASAVLLIAACLSPASLRHLMIYAAELGMSALVEVHNEAELEQVLTCQPEIIGINNRNLRTFEVDPYTALRLLPLIPSPMIKVAESGIHTPEDAHRFADAGFDALLVGEALVTAANPGEKMKELLGVTE
ncbi:indole-3-glycerol phosphate synthase TrpC [Anaerolinea sp.]|uniref:indole-3-glycerol phosphate synthase TrpC n=1 Tax=Anaerolinea sp. TaxID=1872519 RepID=UPI002ACDBE36|nr:indole-3-glycerol phosphate synthase TrpC [Anaerolinea sp.]